MVSTCVYFSSLILMGQSEQFRILFHIASPSFNEAPSDVEVNDGGSIKLPCRAQGRPKPRIIWDRIGGSVTSQSHQQQIGGKIPLYLEKDTQEDLLVKAKIMSLRFKRSISKVSYHIKDNNDKLLAVDVDHLEENEQIQQTFGQIRRNKNHEAWKLIRRERQLENNDVKRDDTIDSDDTGSPDTIPILVFSTQAPQEVSRLQVTDNGELILLDVSERDQVKL